MRIPQCQVLSQKWNAVKDNLASVNLKVFKSRERKTSQTVSAVVVFKNLNKNLNFIEDHWEDVEFFTYLNWFIFKSLNLTARVVKLSTLWDIYASSAQVQMWKLETNQVNYTRGVQPICSKDSNSKLNEVQWPELYSGIGLPHLNEWGNSSIQIET